jgi:hypothetical protein
VPKEFKEFRVLKDPRVLWVLKESRVSRVLKVL